MRGGREYFIKGDAAEDSGDFATARMMFERGAAEGDPYCWARLGLMLDKGIGCDVDKVAAMRCYRRGWRVRDVVAANNIAVLYKEAGNWRAMFQWFRRAADAGDDEALIDVAKSLFDGDGVRKNPEEGRACLARALRGSLSEAAREDAEEMLAKLPR